MNALIFRRLESKWFLSIDAILFVTLVLLFLDYISKSTFISLSLTYVLFNVTLYLIRKKLITSNYGDK